MSLLGLGTRIPGLPTFVTNLIRRGAALAGMPKNAVAAKALPWWYLMLYGDSAKAAALATVTSTPDDLRPRGKSPVEEYSLSIDQTLYEMEVTPALAGRHFDVVARLAYLRYGLSLIGATVPINEDVTSLVAGLPKTYRLVLYPAATVLQHGMKLYMITARPDKLEQFRVETGGTAQSMLEKALETVTSAFVVGQGAAAAARAAEKALVTDEEASAAFSRPTPGGGASGATGWHSGAEAAVAETANAHYSHNATAVTELAVPWCFVEVEETAAAERALLHKLHLDQMHGGVPLPTFNRAGHRTGTTCDQCGRPRTTCHPFTLLSGSGIMTLPSVAVAPHEAAAAVAAAPAIVPVSSDEFSFGPSGEEAAAGAVPTSAPSASVPVDGVAVAAGTTNPLAVATPASAVVQTTTTVSHASIAPLAVAPLVVPRRASLGEDGLGGMDDSDDITGPDGPLVTIAPTFSSAAGIGATAKAAARASGNALAVRLALPVTAVSDVESMAADALDAMSTAKYSGHVLVCGVSDNMGYLLRAIAAIVGRPNPHRGDAEGDQYEFDENAIVVLAQGKPADAAMNAMYPGR